MTDARSIPAPADLFDLTGKVAIVTGGSRGLGRAISEGLARAGADVVVASRKLDACEQAAAEIAEATGRRTLAHACHVGHWDELEGLADAAYEAFGHVDVLVNNAGMSPLYDDVRNVTEELWEKTVGLNLKGPFRLTALVGSRMFEGDGGSIVNISSMAAYGPPTNSIPYGAAKAGLHSMTKGFASLWQRKVRVNTVAAGPFRTDITKAWSYIPEGIGEPHEVVGAVLYFASDASSYTNGSVLDVTG